VSATEVGFYHLTRQPIEVVLPRLLEKAYGAGHRILVHCADAAQLGQLDASLWTYDDASFLPHGSDDKALQPILLTTSPDERANAPDLLAALDRLDLDRIGDFARVLYLFEETDADRLAAARAAWTALKARDGVTRTYWQQDDRGRWEKKG
jgi:DNA polymerase III subunit chi